MSDRSTVDGLALSIIDSVMVLAPRGFREVEMTFVSQQGALKLHELQSQGDGRNEPKPKPQLFVDLKTEAQRLSEAFTELGEWLGTTQHKNWSGYKASVKREEGAAHFVELHLFSEAGQRIWLHRVAENLLKLNLVTEPLFDALLGTEKAFQYNQARNVLNFDTMNSAAFDLKLGTLAVENGANASAFCLGTYVYTDYLWVWVFADDDEAYRKNDVRRICQVDAAPEYLSAFHRSAFHCDEGFAWALAGHVATLMGASGLVRVGAPSKSISLVGVER